MDNISKSENSNTDLEVQEVILEEDSIAEQILKQVIKAYEQGWNKNNEKNECKYVLTITKHKVATPDGNKDVAYLRLDRNIREKGYIEKVLTSNPPIQDDGWQTHLIHQEVYFFKGIKEQVDPRRMWVEQLYMNCIARLIGAGLEYADLLRKMKQVKENQSKIIQPDAPKIEIAKELPKPLSEDDKKYVEWIDNERKKL